MPAGEEDRGASTTHMNTNTDHRWLGLLLTCLALALPGRAQTFTVSSTSFNLSLPVLGQEFTPSVAGPQGTGSSGSGATVFLQSFQFSYSDSIFAPTLRIYSSLPALVTDIVNGLGAGLVGSSTSQSGGIYTFNNLALDRATAYYALLTSTGNINTSTLGGNPYTGGDAVNVSALAPASLALQDTAFTGTFTQTAVPEPGITALGLGLVALVGVIIRRRYAANGLKPQPVVVSVS